MASAGTPPLSPRIPAANPTPPPVVEPAKKPLGWGVTIVKFLVTPSDSKMVRENLAHVYKYKEHRIHGVYVTAITTLRSGADIVVSIGMLILESTTWFVDITRPREEALEIVGRNFVNVIYAIKTTIALPFFAVCGFIVPGPVFGSFGLIEGIESKIAKQEVRLTKLKATNEQTTKRNDEAQGKLDGIRLEIEKAKTEHSQAKEKLDQSIDVVGSLIPALSKLEQLQTLNKEHEAELAVLEQHEDEAAAEVEASKRDLARVGKQLQQAREAARLELERLNSEIASTKANLDSHKREFADVERNLATLKSEYAAQEGQFKQLKDTDLPLLESRQTELSGEIAKLVEQKASIAAQLVADQATYESKKAELNALEESLRGTTATFLGLEQKQTRLNDTTLPDLERQESALKARKTELEKTDIPAVELKLEELNRTHSEKSNELKALTNRIAALKLEQEGLTRALETLAEPTSAPVASSGAAPAGEPTALQEHLTTFLESINTRSAEKAALEESLGKSAAAIETNKATLDSQKREIEKLKVELNTLNGITLTNARGELVNVGNEIKRMRETLVNLTKEKEDASKAIDDLKAKLEKDKLEETRLTTALPELRKEEIALNEKIEKAKKELASLEESLSQQRTAIEAEKKAHEEEKAKYPAKIEELENGLKLRLEIHERLEKERSETAEIDHSAKVEKLEQRYDEEERQLTGKFEAEKKEAAAKAQNELEELTTLLTEQKATKTREHEQEIETQRGISTKALEAEIAEARKAQYAEIGTKINTFRSAQEARIKEAIEKKETEATEAIALKIKEKEAALEAVDKKLAEKEALLAANKKAFDELAAKTEALTKGVLEKRAKRTDDASKGDPSKPAETKEIKDADKTDEIK